MLPLSLSVLLGWTEVVKTQSKRQSVLVCSLLVVSLLLSAAVGGEECARGFPPSDTIDMYGPSSMSAELPSTNNSILYAFPSMNFSCNETITDIRMRMDLVEGLQLGVQTQAVLVHFLLFHDGLNSPTRRVTHMLANSANTGVYFDNSTQMFTQIRHVRSLSHPVTEGTFIGFAIPAYDHLTIFSKNISLSPEPSDRVEAHLYQIDSPFSEFEGRVLEAARTADSSQFTTQMLPLPLIDVSFRTNSATLSSTTPSTSTNLPSPSTEATPSSGLSQLVTIVIPVVVSALLLLVVVVVVVVMVTAMCRRRSKEHTYKDAIIGVRSQATDNDYFEPMSLRVDPTHCHHEPRPLHTPHTYVASGNGDQKDCPAYQPIEDTPTSIQGDCTHGDHISMQVCPAYQPIEDTPTSVPGDYTYIQ